MKRVDSGATIPVVFKQYSSSNAPVVGSSVPVLVHLAVVLISSLVESGFIKDHFVNVK